MKRYDLSKIMKDAWREYKIERRAYGKNGRSFSDMLKLSWARAKESSAQADKISKLGNWFDIDIRGCMIHFNMGDGIISGQTYKVRDILKDYGLKFNGTEKYWEGSREKIENMLMVWA